MTKDPAHVIGDFMPVYVQPDQAVPIVTKSVIVKASVTREERGTPKAMQDRKYRLILDSLLGNVVADLPSRDPMLS
jgi:hypothetical protein